MKPLPLTALLFPLTLLGACQVTTDDANDSVAVSLDENRAEAAGDAIARTADNIAADIKQDVGEEGARLKQIANDVQTDDRPGDVDATAGDAAAPAGDANSN